jgi:hypothetical protein
MRTELGANARRWAATRTIQANVWRWETAYRSGLRTETGDARELATIQPARPKGEA